MILFVNFSNGGHNWCVGPLLMFALPALLNGGFSQLVAGIVHVVSLFLPSLSCKQRDVVAKWACLRTAWNVPFRVRTNRMHLLAFYCVLGNASVTKR
jgi:hypothetical protein